MFFNLDLRKYFDKNLKKIIQLTQPDIVMVELCQSRVCFYYKNKLF
jgi:pheromone shutdown protein TraB